MSEIKESGVTEFMCDSLHFKYNEEMKEAFDRDGGFIAKNFLSADEVQKILVTLTGSEVFKKHAWEVADGEGRCSRLVLWNHPGNDITGLMARSEKIVNTCEKLLGGEVYHYHTKLMMKEAHTGGKHVWHQDYGYWYKNGCLRPDMLTVFIALDPCIKENGGLQILRGSQACGRIEHVMYHGQTMADLDRVEHLKKNFEHMYVPLQPGDAFFFHCNVLHTSDKNDSDMRRWAFLCAYNKADNDPVYKHHHPNYVKLDKVADCEILSCVNSSDFTGKDFMDPSIDETVRATLLETKFH